MSSSKKDDLPKGSEDSAPKKTKEAADQDIKGSLPNDTQSGLVEKGTQGETAKKAGKASKVEGAFHKGDLQKNSAARDSKEASPKEIDRRDFLNVAAVGLSGIGVCAAAIPFIAQMNPTKDVAEQEKTEVDISSVQPGQTVKVVWQGQPVFIRNLTEQEITEANAVALSDLRDPETLEQRTKAGKNNWLVTMALCTHLGCIPQGGNAGEPKGEYGGYMCSCHGSAFDTAGRIRRGPAPTNLVVPPYRFVSPSVISIG